MPPLKGEAARRGEGVLLKGEQRTETLSFKSLIKENCILKVELISEEVSPLSYQVGLNYSRMEQ